MQRTNTGIGNISPIGFKVVSITSRKFVLRQRYMVASSEPAFTGCPMSHHTRTAAIDSALLARTLALTVSAFTATTAAGLGSVSLWDAVFNARSHLRANDFTQTAITAWIGRVNGLETAALPARFSDWECRNNRLAWLALNQDGFYQAGLKSVAHFGPRRIAVIMGTSTGSVGATEEAYTRLTANGSFADDLLRPIVHSPHSLGDFVQHALGTSGPCVTVNTACSSSAKVFAQAERLMRLGVVDAAIVGGVDTLCGSVMYGFNSLQLLSPEPCRPFDADRNGISLGEAGGFALLTQAVPGDAQPALRLVGWGESSDAYHMSSPQPDGLGAERAMLQALSNAGLNANAIDYINGHGTASLKNDEVEANVVARNFPATTRMSSTKGITGHALGAAGIVEAVISLLALQHDWVPANAGTKSVDPLATAHLALHGEAKLMSHVLSNNFGFGGNNCALIFAKNGSVQ